MSLHNIKTSIITRALKEAGITNPDDRRAFLVWKNLREKVMGVLENNPKLQEELAHTMGIGDKIIGHLHEVMEEDFQESDVLLSELIQFFQTHGNLDLSIFDITEKSVRSFHPGNKQERTQEIDTLFPVSDTGDYINEKMLLLGTCEESSIRTEGLGWQLSLKIVSPIGTDLIFSFGNKDTPKNVIEKIRKLFKKTGLLRRIWEKLKHIQVKYTDHLTGLYNKHYIQSAVENNIPYSVVFLDLDKFKEYNDIYGHSAWDRLLQEVAGILQSSIRNNDKVCRNGGDEFIIFIDECWDYKEIDKIRERMWEKIDAYNFAKQQSTDISGTFYPPISVTSGYAIWDWESTLEDIVRRADKNMLEDKWGEWEFYRNVHKMSRYSLKKQKEALAQMIALNPELASFARDLFENPQMQDEHI